MLATGEHAEKMIREGTGRCFDLKEDSIGPPKTCLGGSVRKVELSNGMKAWAFSSSQCVQAAVKNVEECLQKRQRKSPSKAETPMRTSYPPELDVTSELNAQDGTHYQLLIGIL